MCDPIAADVQVVRVVPCFDGQSVSKRKWHLQRSPALISILAQVRRGLSYLMPDHWVPRHMVPPNQWTTGQQKRMVSGAKVALAQAVSSLLV